MFRCAALAALAAALINPVLLDEERDPLKSVVALIVDRSQSQDIGARQAETSAALAGLQERLARFKQFEVRVIEAGRADAADERAETRLFSALDGAFRDVPPSRIAGAVMITDGQVHDVPGSAKNFPAPLHALITGDEDERDRRIRFENAPRFGLVGKPLEMSYRVIVGQWRARNGRCAGLDQRPAGIDASARRSARRCRSRSSFPGPAAISSNWRSTPPMARSPTPTTAPSPSSTASARTCACCWFRASRMPANAPGATC